MLEEVDFFLVTMAMVRDQNENSGGEMGTPFPQFFSSNSSFWFWPNSKAPSPDEGLHPHPEYCFSIYYASVMRQRSILNWCCTVVTKLDMKTHMPKEHAQGACHRGLKFVSPTQGESLDFVFFHLYCTCCISHRPE